MLRKTLITGTLLIMVLAAVVFLTYNAGGILFNRLPWFMAGAIVLGIILGIYRGLRTNSARPADRRHNLDSFLEHWATGAGILILIVSGFFIEVSLLRRESINLHYLGLVTALLFGVYFLTHFLVSRKYRYLMPGLKDILNGTLKKYLLRARWQDTGKYLASQKSAFLAFAVLGSAILITGAEKTVALYFGLPTGLTNTATQIHDIAARLFVLLFLVHILMAVLVPSHRRLLASFFTGKNVK